MSWLYWPKIQVYRCSYIYRRSALLIEYTGILTWDGVLHIGFVMYPFVLGR